MSTQGQPKTDREVDLEAARDYFEEQTQIRHDAIQGAVGWMDGEAAKGRFPVPVGIALALRRALKGER